MHKERFVRRVALVAAAVVLSLCFVVGSFPANARGEEVELWAAATTEDLKNDEIWLTQSVSGKCTLASTAMMLRRAAFLNGRTDWRDITEQSIQSAAWDSSAGLRWFFSYGDMNVSEVDLRGSNESVLIDLLASHPEGVVIYNWAHAVLLTDYTDGVLYCADPAFGDRRPLDESSRGVNANNIYQYWYVSSRVAAPEGQNTFQDEVGPAVEITGAWVSSGSRWWYRWSDGSYAHEETLNLDGTLYHFDSDGWLVTGWWLEDGTWYYSSASGAVRTGWLQSGGTWYWLDPDSGAMVTGWQKVNGTWYYFRASGAMATGWVNDGGAWYWMRDSGALATGWVYAGGRWYFMRDSGAMATGWIQLGDTWYRMHDSGAMATGWCQINGLWYWFYSSGAMASSRWVGNYYLGTSGAMLTDTVTPDGYRVLASGAWDGQVRGN